MKKITIKNTEYNIKTKMSEVDLLDIQSEATDMIGDLDYDLACDIAKILGENYKVELDEDSDGMTAEWFCVRKANKGN